MSNINAERGMSETFDNGDRGFPERKVADDDDAQQPQQQQQNPSYRQLKVSGLDDDNNTAADADTAAAAAAAAEVAVDARPSASTSAAAPSAAAASSSSSSSIPFSGPRPFSTGGGVFDIGDIFPENGFYINSGKKEKEEETKPKRVPPRLKPMMPKREVLVCNVVLAVMSMLIGPGLIVVSSMLASAASFLAAQTDTTLFSAISGVFIPVGIALTVTPPLLFFVFDTSDESIDKTGNAINRKKKKGDADEVPPAQPTFTNNGFLYHIVPTLWNGGSEVIEYAMAKQDEAAAAAASSSEPLSGEKLEAGAREIPIPDNHPLHRTCGQKCVSWTLRIIVALVLIISLIAGIFAVTIHTLKANTPSWSVNYPSVAAPSGNPVRLARDGNGVAHITAKTRKDAMFALGFVQAQDRLFQLEVLRLIGRGTFAKYVGSSGLNVDKLMRTLRIKEAADQTYSGLSAENKALCDAFVDGVNAFLAVEYARPAEFMFMSRLLDFHEPAKFTGADCALFLRLLQYQMSTSTFALESNRWKKYMSTNTTAGALSYDDLAAFFHNRLGRDNTTTPYSLADLGMTLNDATYNAAILFEQETKAREKEIWDEGVMDSFRKQGNTAAATTPTSAPSPHHRRSSAEAQQPEESGSSSASSSSFSSKKFSWANVDAGRLFDDLFSSYSPASNAWAARGANLETMHCSDPHLPNTVPAVWYFFHIYIQDEDFHISGGSPVGIPGVLNGRTSNVRFGHTLSVTDQGDLFVMQADATTTSTSSTHYMHNGVSKAYTVFEEEIEVMGRSSKEKLTVRIAPEYGPDVSQVMGLVHEKSDLRICAYLEALQDDADTLAAVLALNSPALKTVADVQTALKKVRAPGLGSVYSDEVGGIGTTTTGRYRIRAKGHTGRVPTIGNGTFDYVGVVPTASVPSKINTDNTTTAYVWQANSRPDPTGFQYPLSFDDYSVERSRVISDVLAAATASELSSVSFHEKLLNNQMSGFWLYTVQRDLRLFGSSSSAIKTAFESMLSSAGSSRWSAMTSWDGVARKGSTEASDLWRWIFRIGETDAILTEKRSSYMRSDSLVQYVGGFIGNPTVKQRQLCATKLAESASPSSLSCAKYAAVIWNDVAEMSRAGWAVDVAEKIDVQHLLLHGSIVQGLFSRRMAKGGDPTSPDITKVNAGDKTTNPSGLLFVGSSGPSARWIFTQPTSSNDYTAFRFNVPAGNSGNVFTDFYFNMVDDFVAEPPVYRAVKHWTNPSEKVDNDKMKQRLG